jgi:hypothetical protein
LARAAQESRWNTAASCWAPLAQGSSRSLSFRRNAAHRDYPRNAVLFVFFRDFGRKFHGDSTVEVP